MKQHKRKSHAVRQLRNACFLWTIAIAFFAFGQLNSGWLQDIDGLSSVFSLGGWIAVACGLFCAFAALASITVHQDQKADVRSRKAMAKTVAKGGSTRRR